MGRAVVRGHAVVLTLALAAPALAGCSAGPRIVSDGSDLDAAAAVWSDPWVAPTSATVAGPALGSDGQVTRVVGRRSTAYATGVEVAARAEVDLAADAGWRPTSSTCGTTVQVALVGPDDALAQLVVTPDGGSATAALQVVVPHHLDTGWEAPDPVADTCLDGRATGFVPPPLQSRPVGEEDADDVGTDAAAWPDDRPDDGAVAAASSDPGLVALGLRVVAPRLETGVNRRRAPAAEATVTARSLARLARRLAGWDLTYAACGAGGPVRATFARDLDGSPAVLSVSLAGGDAQVRVVLPATDGPAPGWLDGLEPLDPTTACAEPDDSLLEVLGVPAVLPDALTRVVD